MKLTLNLLTKSRTLFVRCESISSGYSIDCCRDRYAGKLEFVAFDPYIQQKTIYKEKRKLRSLEDPIYGLRRNVVDRRVPKDISDDPF
ncbi:hypothetical protein GJ496_001729 [Pomphorhynchus laevis]|nr:hypothetical protein GJ496_001729 [Pomphorhynchus laevis]